MNLKQGIVAGFMGAAALTAQGAETLTSERYIVKLDTDKPYVAFVAGKVAHSFCKIMNGQKVYIAAPGAELPGTSNFDYLDKEAIDRVLTAPDCRINIKRQM